MSIFNITCSRFKPDHQKINMKKLFLLLFAFVALSGSAQIYENYKIHVGQFDKLKVTDNVNVVYRCLPDSSGWAQFRGTEEFADAFILTPKNGQLRVQVSTDDVGHPNLPTLYVYSDFLTSVENASTFTLTIENPAPCAEFSIKEIGNGTINVENVQATTVKATLATGNGTISISGTCSKAQFNMVGTGLIAADRLKTHVAECKILGSGSIGCWATQKLTSRGIGSTKIYYKGNPIIKKSGGGKIFELPKNSDIKKDAEEDSED